MVIRGEPIVLKILMIMLCCTAHEMRHLCSWNCQIMLKNVLKCVTDLDSVEQKVAFYGDFLADSS